MQGASISRRRVLGGVVAVPAAALAGTVLSRAGAAATTGPLVGSAQIGPTNAGAARAALAVQAAELPWASGGSGLITVPYPQTSIFDPSAACSLSLTEATTLGPCYFASDTGEDITVGKTGLPMQLCLRLIGNECAPLAGYTVEVWHTDTRGTYSGDTSESADSSTFAGSFCTGGDAEAEASTYFRGQRTTDAEGRVNFKTCFPGWYRGRTIHIHFAVTDPDGSRRVISQFAFTDEFCDEVCTTHGLYASRGVQDTPLAQDNVFPSSGYEDFLLATSQNSDGTLLGFATIRVDADAALGGDLGDVDGSGVVDSTDAELVLDGLVGNRAQALAETADMDSDGTVDLRDAWVIANQSGS